VSSRTDEIYITITNWDKYNARNDVKRPHWFRLDHDLFDDEKLTDMTPADFCFLIYLLCRASKNTNRGTLLLVYSHVQMNTRLKRSEIDAALYKLEQKQIVHRSVRTRPDPAGSVRYTTLQDTTLQDSIYIADSDAESPPQAGSPPVGKQRATVFRAELDLIYKTKYPRKEGKARGMIKLMREIQTPDDLTLFDKAVSNFAAHHKRMGTQAQYLKHFSTFAAEWRDWIDPDHGSVSSEFTTSQSQGIDWSKFEERADSK
jgi:hypothetical protein